MSTAFGSCSWVGRDGGLPIPRHRQRRFGQHRHQLRRDERARPDPLQAVDDHPLARGDTLRHDPETVDRRSEGHLAVFGLVVLADDRHELLVLVGADRALADQHRRLGRGASHLQAGELARYQQAVGVGEDRASENRAARPVDLVVDELKRTLVRGAVARRRVHPYRNAPQLFVRLGTERSEHTRHRFLVRAEARVDRVDGHQRRQHRRTRAGRHQVADRDLEPAHAAGDGGAHRSVPEVEPRHFEAGLGRAQVRFSPPLGVEALIEVALRNDAALPELAAPVELAPGENELRLRRRHLRFGASDLRRVGRGIDRDQEVALPDERTLAEMHGLHLAGDPRPDVHPLDSLEPTGELVP
jgi:hypothetical protein